MRFGGRLRSVLTLVALSQAALVVCQKTDRVTLSIDFTGAGRWTYFLGVDVKGEMAQGDTGQVFSGSLRTYLKGDSSEGAGDAVVLRAAGTRVVTNFLDEAERQDIERRCEGMALSFSPRQGALHLADTTGLPSPDFGGWDLLRSFARVLPALPEGEVAPGTSWERERQFPIETSHGSAVGHLFQSFRFDSMTSLDSIPRAAALSWLFSYRIELLFPDSLGLLRSVPLKGEGSGRALLDIGKRELAQAHAVFSAPPVGADRSQVVWTESVHLSRVD